MENKTWAVETMVLIRFEKLVCSGCRGEGLVGRMTQEGGEGEECPFCHGKTMDEMIDEKNSLLLKHNDLISALGTEQKNYAYTLNYLREENRKLKSERDGVFNQLISERNLTAKEREENVKTLKQISDYGKDNDGCCPYGCDTPTIAAKALKHYK